MKLNFAHEPCNKFGEALKLFITYSKLYTLIKLHYTVKSVGVDFKI